MSEPTVLVTGALGCIGVPTIQWLLDHGNAQIVAASRSISDESLRQRFSDDAMRRLSAVQLDVSDASQVAAVFRDHQITHVIHLAALQTPDCNANRDLGLQINLAGTQHIIEAIKSSGTVVQRLVYASSIAVYGPRSYYQGERVPMLAEPRPVNVYGVWKLASEHLCRVFHEEFGTPTVCLRPGVLFGPGRDRGLTSTPTTAMKHAVQGTPYVIPFKNRQDYLYAPDVGAAFAIAAQQPFDGYGVFTLPSHTVDTAAFVAAIESACADLGLATPCRISVGDGEVPFVCDLEYEPFCKAFENVPHTALAAAVRESLRFFAAARAR